MNEAINDEGAMSPTVNRGTTMWRQMQQDLSLDSHQTASYVK